MIHRDVERGLLAVFPVGLGVVSLVDSLLYLVSLEAMMKGRRRSRKGSVVTFGWSLNWRWV